MAPKFLLRDDHLHYFLIRAIPGGRRFFSLLWGSVDFDRLALELFLSGFSRCGSQVPLQFPRPRSRHPDACARNLTHTSPLFPAPTACSPHWWPIRSPLASPFQYDRFTKGNVLSNCIALFLGDDCQPNFSHWMAPCDDPKCGPSTASLCC